MLEPDGGNLYRPHMLMVHSGKFWRCEHGKTGMKTDSTDFDDCLECAVADPEAYKSFTGRLDPAPDFNRCPVHKTILIGMACPQCTADESSGLLTPGPVVFEPEPRQVTIVLSMAEVCVCLLAVAFLALTLGLIARDVITGTAMRRQIDRCQEAGAACIYVVLPETLVQSTQP